MKKFVKLLSVLLALFISLGAFASCKDGENVDDNKTAPVTPFYEGGNTHSISAQKTDDYIVVAGKSDYKIVISATASNSTLLAVDELNYFMKQSTGVTFPVIHEVGLTVTENSKYIVLGNTELTKAAGITLDYDTYGNDGYVIKTMGKTIYMGGYSGNGDIFAVYEFLKHTVNYAYYTIMTVNVDKTKYVNLYDFSVVDIPDFAQRITGTSGWQSGHYKETTVKRYRNDLTDEAFLHPSQLSGYGHFHNTQWWLPASTYMAEHDEWYSADGNEFCYTAHGDADEYEKMQAELIQRIVIACKRWPSTTNINITHNDYGYKCNCDTCLIEAGKCNGSYSGMIIKFMNDLEEKVNAYMKTNEDGLPKDRTFTIQFFAYSFTIVPPVVLDSEGNPKKDANGNYTILNEEYKTNPNVHVWFAPLSAQFVDALDHQENYVQYEQYLAWQAVVDKVDFWIYGTNFKDVMAPYLGINSFVENARMFAKDGNNGLILYEQESSAVGIGFKKLQGYITSNISWNINYSVPELMNDYFESVYGPAAKTMRSYYDDMTTYMYSMIEAGVLSKDVYAGTSKNSDLFTYSVCNRWMNYVEQALEDIESVKATDPERYQIYYDEIINESFTPRYYTIKFYESSYSPDQANEMKKSLIEDMDRISAYVEEDYNVWENYIAGWRREIY